jgi:thiol-disulfide isomerase/thioredoxin
MIILLQKRGDFDMQKRLVIFLLASFLTILVFASSSYSGQEPKSPPPQKLVLNQTKPNPFDVSTTISYELSEPLYIELSIYDRIGYSIKASISSFQEAGHHEVVLDLSGLPYGDYSFGIRIKPTRESPRQRPIIGPSLFYTEGLTGLTFSADEGRRFNHAFTNCFDDPPQGVRLMQELLKDFPNTIFRPSVLYMTIRTCVTIYKNSADYPAAKTGLTLDAQHIMALCRQLIELAPTSLNYQFVAQQLSECAIALPKALDYANYALRLNEKGKFYNQPDLRLDILQTIGKIYLAMKDPGKALISLNKCLLLCDSLLGDVNQGDYEKAKAQALKPSILLDLGKAYLGSGQWDKAEQVLSESFYAQPANKEVFNAIKAVYIRKHGSLTEFDTYYDALNKRALALIPAKPLVRLNRKALEFELSSLDGTRVKLSDFKGKPVVLNFWGYWCGACKEEIPLLQELWNEYHDRGLMVLAVHFNPGVYSDEENREKLTKFLAKNRISIPILLHEGDLASRYGGSSVPTTFLIDKNGLVQYEFMGFDKNSDMPKKIQEKAQELIDEIRR